MTRGCNFIGFGLDFTLIRWFICKKATISSWTWCILKKKKSLILKTAHAGRLLKYFLLFQCEIF